MQNISDIQSVIVERGRRFKTQEIKELVSELKGLREKRQQLLSENARLRQRLDTLKAEIEGTEIVAGTISNEINTTKSRLQNYPEILSNLEDKKEKLIDEINKCQISMKTASKNIKNFLTLKSHLDDELLSIVNEKSVYIKKLKDIETGVNLIAEQRHQRSPEIKQYDMLLRQLSKVFKEMQNKVDLSIKFANKMKGYN